MVFNIDQSTAGVYRPVVTTIPVGNCRLHASRASNGTAAGPETAANDMAEATGKPVCGEQGWPQATGQP